jgi:FtsZ-binding cell division protein ZapB
LEVKYLDDLEDKVQTLITTLENVRKDNENLRQNWRKKSSAVSELEAENNRLKQELDTLQVDTTGHKSKLETVTQRIQGILTRLESVQ